MRASELVEAVQTLMGIRGNDPVIKISTQTGHTIASDATRLDLYGPDDGYPDWGIKISDNPIDNQKQP